ncbi:hypothetical protein T07_1733 [Trichinella nelsoni]|uniref:Uncharacterized protein n=1 Tax=Trichinella nelsoni TaxID=6336 RepID=A0A0V0RGV6_9BILA|nr:hypothetical protein T07_1733 [Trichinella nelsoni]
MNKRFFFIIRFENDGKRMDVKDKKNGVIWVSMNYRAFNANDHCLVKYLVMIQSYEECEIGWCAGVRWVTLHDETVTFSNDKLDKWKNSASASTAKLY